MKNFFGELSPEQLYVRASVRNCILFLGILKNKEWNILCIYTYVIYPNYFFTKTLKSQMKVFI